MKFTEKQIVFMRWLSRTVGGEMPVEGKEMQMARKLVKAGMIDLWHRPGRSTTAKFTSAGMKHLKKLGWEF